MKMKYIISSIVCMIACAPAFAQVQYIPAAGHEFSIGVGGGVTQLYGDFGTTVIESAERVNLDYNITPFISAGIEAQTGNLSAKGAYLNLDHKHGFVSVLNSYTAGNANVRVGLGQFLKHSMQTKFVRIIGGLYLGTGVGVISNNVTNKIPVKDEPIEDFHPTSTETLIPINVGINVELPKIFGVSNIVFNVNVQDNMILGDYIDGYNSRFSTSSDSYAYISAALRFNFGPIRRLR